MSILEGACYDDLFGCEFYYFEGYNIIINI